MLIFVVGIQSTPVEVMEAATVDGASCRRITRVLIDDCQRLHRLALPDHRQFLQDVRPQRRADQGGPYARFMGQAVNSSQLLTLTIYNKSIATKELAKGQAMSVVLFIVLVVFSLIQVTMGKRREAEA